MNRKEHWEKIYQTKAFKDVGWYQVVPAISLGYLEELDVRQDQRIIDVGGGDSYFVDHLLDLGYNLITVLDISESAISRARERLGKSADKVSWLVADVIDFKPGEKYDVWHDRAAFHFLTDEAEVDQYLHNAYHYLNDNGLLIIGTFSEKGPLKCSGIPIHQYSKENLRDRFMPFFDLISCKNTDHITPSGVTQNYTFCSFRKK